MIIDDSRNEQRYRAQRVPCSALGLDTTQTVSERRNTYFTDRLRRTAMEPDPDRRWNTSGHLYNYTESLKDE